MPITDTIHDAVTRIPRRAWTPAYNADGQVREGAWLSEITDMLNLTGWPQEMRLIVRADAPAPEQICGSPTPTATGSPASPPTPWW